MEIDGPVCVVTCTREREIKGKVYNRKHIVGVTSTLEKAWKVIQRDYRLIAYREELKFTDTSPWGGVYDGFRSKDFKTIYHIETHRIDLWED